MKDYTAQIRSISDDGKRIMVNRSFEQVANSLSEEDVSFTTYLDGIILEHIQNLVFHI